MSIRSASSNEVLVDRSDESDGTDPSRVISKGGRGGGSSRRGKGRTNVKKASTSSVRTRSQRKKDPQGADTMSTDSGHGDSGRSLWKDEAVDQRDSKSACASIIEKYRMDFGGKQPPKIPLCRLEPFTRVRKLQLSCSQAEELKRSFRLNGYMESCHGFHVSPVDESGNDVVLISEEEDSWDFFWKTASQDFDRECRADPDLECLAGKKFKVWDGNHRLTVWLQVSSEEKFRNSLIHYSRVRCVVVKPPPNALKEMEVAMHNLNITSHATVQYDWIQDAERTLQVLSTPLVEYKPLLGDKVFHELEESRKKTTTRGWYSVNMTITAGAYVMSYSEVMAAQKELGLMEKDMERKGTPWTEKQKNDKWKRMLSEATRHWNNLIQKHATIVNPQLGPEFMSTVRELQTTLSQQEKGKRDVKVEVGIDRIKAFAAAPVPPELKVKLLKSVESIAEVQAEEEDKFLFHVEEYKNKFWKELWNSGSQDRIVNHVGRRAKRVFFRYSVWVRQFEVFPACFTYWRKPPSDQFSMFSDDDGQSRKYDDLGDWERAKCPFYVDYVDDPPIMFDEMEQLCYD
ncbi:hypothetical protein R1sor_026803 [Riccia sorocarpa]|uniref:Uncharacterized protein n=1 Tax=Riccia sorocarpa TaxID=122646 RepID=A0ABD3GFR6_9MARC